METITNINSWKRQLGLYPILMDPKLSVNKYLMLNGGNKDFCLQTSDLKNDKVSFFSDSWSTNTKNFVALDTDYAHIYNWYNDKIERYPLRHIEDNTDKFYAYLSSKSYKTPNDAVPFIIDKFRRLRNFTREKDTEKALNLLFKLLISIDEDYSKIDLLKWDIADIQVPPEFDLYVEEIRRGISSIPPKRDLILRHVAGALFQEAHKEVIYFDYQTDLWSGFSNKLITKNDSYSSVHYTPNYLARTIVENCLKQLDWQNKRILKIFDPACGSSEFLIETLKQLQSLNYRGQVKIIGWDTSASAVCTSKFLLKYEQRTQWNSETMKFEIKHVTDSLSEQWDNDYDLIVMNPPFLSWELLKDKDKKDAILDTLGLAFKAGKPNQASAFFYKAAKSLNKNGVIGCVLPSTLFTSDSYSKLRNEIHEDLTLILLAKLGNYIFESALTDVSFFIGKKEFTNNFPQILWSKNEKGIAEDALCNLRKMEYANRTAVDTKNYSIYMPACFPVISDSWKIISLKGNKFLDDVRRFVLDGQLTSISDVFSVKQGIRTGNNRAFVLSCEEYNMMPESEKNFYRKVINNDSVKQGVLSLVNYIWYPYDSKGMLIANETEFRNIAPFSYDRLLPFKDALSQNRARKDFNTWWHLSEHRAWLREKGIRLYSTEFGKSDSFAIDKSGDFVVERGCAWIPKKTFTMDDYYFYLSVFSSSIFDFLLSIYSKPIQSGYYLGQIYTKNIPIPNVHLSEVRESDAYCRLVVLGKELENGNLYVKPVIGDVLKNYYPPT